MTGRSLRLLLPAVFLGAGLCACDLSTGLDNHRPVISSATVVPDSIGLPDSTTVTVNATDPDGEALFYDWTTDARLRIKGAAPGVHSVRGTSANSMVFYPDNLPSPPDTCWVDCTARDIRGLSDSRRVTLIVGP